MPHRAALEYLHSGRPQEAAELLQARLREYPADAPGWFLLGACRHALDELPAATEAFARSLALDPSRSDAHLALVTVLRESGNLDDALSAGQQALTRLSGDARLHYATGVCLDELGRPDEALQRYDAALALEPNFEDALHNRGLLLARTDRLEQAEINYRRYVALMPLSPRAQGGLADVLIALGRFSDALTTLDRLAILAPGDVSVQVRRGVALASLRRFADARAEFAVARSRDENGVAGYVQRVTPGADAGAMLCPENIYLGHAWKALGDCNWTEWSTFADAMRSAAADPHTVLEPAVAFMSRLVPLTGAERHAVCRRVAAVIEARHPPLPSQAANKRTRIRIGVLSPDFREHLNAYLLRPFFELLDRTRFEAYAYSLGVDDGSAIRAAVRSAADQFRDLQPLPDRDAARTIRSDDLDILLDVGGHTTGARFAITAQRPARLQVNYLGFSCSLASRRVDYAIVDRISGGENTEWTEARAFLPDTHFLYDFRQPAPELQVGRQEYGLSEHAFVYCAFHRAEKISPDVFDLWMTILSQVPGAVLWFRGLSERAVWNLRVQAAGAGIDAARLVFAPFEPFRDPRYLARHALGDLMLDSLHHNAMTSACDALGMGLPLVTLPGNAAASRASASMLHAAGLPDLVAKDREDYVRLAVRLGTDPAATRALKGRLAAARRTAPLFDTQARIRALERALQKMVERMARGEPPASFDA